MTLTAEESSNKEWLESESTENLITIIRTAMENGCIRPCHVYDAVDEVLCRLASVKSVADEMRKFADETMESKENLTNCDVAMAKKAERTCKARELRMFADRLDKISSGSKTKEKA